MKSVFLYVKIFNDLKEQQLCIYASNYDLFTATVVL